MKQHLIVLLAVVVMSCATSTHQPTSETGEAAFTNLISEEDYTKLVEGFTVSEQKYSGFYSAYQFHATILNANVQDAQLSLKAQDYKWPRETYFSEKEKVSGSLSRESKVFMSFYSPVQENDNLDSNKTIWKLWLVVDNVRYEGTASRLPGILAQHQRLYSYHSRFFTPYVLTFKIPMARTQGAAAKLIITGPIGTSEVEFPISSQTIN